MNPLAITSLKLTSKTAEQYKYFTSWDKLKLDTREVGLSHRDSKRRIKVWNKRKGKIEISTGKEVLSGGKPYHFISWGNAKIHFRTIGKKDSISQVFLNPSSFDCFQEFVIKLSHLFDWKKLENSTIRRLDFACDFLEPIESFCHNIDVNHKRVYSDSLYSGKKIASMSFGKRDSGEQIITYDKTKELQCGKRVTRIESRLFWPQIRKNQLVNLPLLLDRVENGSLFSIFHKIKIKDFQLLETDSRIQNQKKECLEFGLRICPLPFIRKRLNINRNFDRDFSKVLKRTEPDLQFWIIMRLGLCQWFEKGSEYEAEH